MRYLLGLLISSSIIFLTRQEVLASPAIEDAAAMDYNAEPVPARAQVARLTIVQPSGVKARRPEFQVPEKLRPRVNFWVDVFTIYGKNQVVIHHRDFPQAVFTVMDFSAEDAELSDLKYEKLKDAKVKSQIKQIETILLALGRGETPRTQLEKNVARAMELVPGSNSKFQNAVRDDLVRSQTGIRERYGEAIKRSNRYMHFIERIFVQDFGLPVELTRLPFIESSFNYQAYSSVGAAGIWQFMRATGRKYMTVNNLIDERRDVLASTRAAARYLYSAYKSLGNWPLAITSYNHGVAGVYKKVRAFGSTDLARIVEDPNQRVFGFASTNFYPEFLAALEVYDNRKHYFPEIIEDAPIHLKEVPLTQAVSVGYILKRYPNLDLEQLKAVNYAVSDAIWNGRYKLPAGYVLKVPSDIPVESQLLRGEVSTQQTQHDQAPASSAVYGGTSYKVRPGDTVSSLARKFNTTAQSIMELNGMNSTALRVGQMLRVKGSGVPTPTARKVAEQEQKAESAARSYRVQSGDSLWSISRKYGVSVDALKRANGSKAAKLKPGQTLSIP